MSLIVDGTTGVTFNDSSLQGAAASPFGLKNRIINGDMVVNQRGSGTLTLTASPQYPVDRFTTTRDTSSATCTSQQSTTVPSSATFNKSVLWTTSTGASPASGDDNSIYQHIEGYNFADFGFGTSAAQSFTLSFWVRSSVTGTYGVSLSNSAADRCYMATYSIAVANTWEYKTITVAGDTSGTWLTTNGIGLRIYWDMGCGTSRSIAASSSWGSSYGPGLTGGVKLIQTTGATFYITGVQLERNTTATPFEWLPYGTELALCQRYYIEYPASTITTGFQDGTTSVVGTLNTPVTLRATPTMTYGAGTTYALIETTYKTSNSTSLSGINFYGANQVQFKLGGFTGLNDLRIANLLPPGKITISSEL